MTTRPDSDATKGSAALALSQRATSIVDARTRRSDPFADRSAVAITLSNCRSRDDDTTPGAAIRHAIRQDHLVALPRPGSGRDCLTVRDARRIAACHTHYRRAGEEDHAATCAAMLREGLPDVLGVEWVRGP